mmetsp:Transcript_52989/g.106221  ORF Transcript_52989/g.106221 Transcript_52989/m.106221 type:complete len:276 (+) Transcript_52989:80-907(+)
MFLLMCPIQPSFLSINRRGQCGRRSECLTITPHLENTAHTKFASFSSIFSWFFFSRTHLNNDFLPLSTRRRIRFPFLSLTLLFFIFLFFKSRHVRFLAAESRHGDGFLDGGLAFRELGDALLHRLDLRVLKLDLDFQFRFRRVEASRVVGVPLADEDRLLVHQLVGELAQVEVGRAAALWVRRAVHDVEENVRLVGFDGGEREQLLKLDLPFGFRGPASLGGHGGRARGPRRAGAVVAAAQGNHHLDVARKGQRFRHKGLDFLQGDVQAAQGEAV